MAARTDVIVRIPSPLRPLTGGQGEVSGKPGTLRALIDDLERTYPGMKSRLCEDDGTLRRFINVFVNEEDIRFLEGLDTALEPGTRVSILPAVAGG